MGPEDVLPLSAHLYVVEQGWPRSGKTGTSLSRLSRAGQAIDDARRHGSTLKLPGAALLPQKQPVGVLYRETEVLALLSFIRELRIALRSDAPAMHTMLDELHAVLERAVADATPLVRPFQYAEDERDPIVTVVSVRKSFVFWGTDMGDESDEALADISVLWRVGEVVELSAGMAHTISQHASVGYSAEQSARAYERRVREAETNAGSSEANELDRLLARDAELTPRPSAAGVIPSRADILWRPRRLEAVDVERLRRWVRGNAFEQTNNADLTRVLQFIESAGRERANLLLDAFVTDSPEAV